MEAVALFDYAAQEPDELTLCKGDVIIEVHAMDGGWWHGTLSKDGKQGLFPDNFVKVITTTPNSNDAGTLTGKKYRVKYNYIPVNADELELNVNDLIELISEVEEGWWEGKLKNKIGVFPSNFVTEVNDSEVTAKDDYSSDQSTTVRNDEKMEVDEPKSTRPVSMNNVPELPPKPKPVREMCVALFPYEAKHEDELTLKENDVITLLSTELPDKGWWKGQLNGKIGVFPDNFVKLITVGEEATKPKRPSTAKMNKMHENNKSRGDGVISTSVAALRKSLENPTVAIAGEDYSPRSKKPVVSKKPSFTQSGSSSESLKTSESPSAAKSDSDRKSWTETVYKVINSPSETSATVNIVTKMDDDEGGMGEIDLNVVGRSELLSHPTASRARAPKRRPPSVINLKEDEMTSHMNTGKIASNAKVMINGTTADVAQVQEKAKAAPWLEELKISQVKKSASQANVRSGFTSSGSNVTFRFQRPVSMFSGEPESHSLTFGPKSTPLVGEQSSSTNEIVTSPTKMITISANVWKSLNEKINNMEVRMEMQNEYFRKSIEQLKLTMVKEIELRLEMKKEMDKLMDLVTQV